jgi:LysM repeat protein
MEKRTSAAARLIAALALVGAVLIVVVVIGAAMSDDDSSSREQRTERPAKKQKKQQPKVKTYTVETGDTLTAIAEETGVSVDKILELNPDVDPQILVAGETLKLR